MKFAKLIFLIAGIWGVLTLTPLYFIYDMVGQKNPPPITHPGFYYGFAGVALASQFAFLVIAKDPVRFRVLMIPAVLEKLGFGIPTLVLFVQKRLTTRDLGLGCIDLLLAALFLIALGATASSTLQSGRA